MAGRSGNNTALTLHAHCMQVNGLHGIFTTLYTIFHFSHTAYRVQVHGLHGIFTALYATVTALYTAVCLQLTSTEGLISPARWMNASYVTIKRRWWRHFHGPGEFS